MIPRHPEATRTATLFPDSTLFRSVMCTADPQSSQFHAEVAAMAKRVSDHVIPKTRAYHEIWYGGERVASSELEERSEEHTSELQSLMRISYAVFCLKKKPQHDYASYNRWKSICHTSDHRKKT